ncbi:MAG: DNA polymerase IV [Cellulosilyticaceae bacterium]
MQSTRKIIHVDMDAFYASVEKRENPELEGKPIIVGGKPHERGVVATCSYEARAYGIHSAMSSRMAYNLCPHAIFIKPRHELYKSISLEIREIFSRYTDQIEPLSLDEAYLDVTVNKKQMALATHIARAIKEDIQKELNLSASAGVSYNKFLAKIASDLYKPAGLAVIRPEQSDVFLAQLPIEKFHGVGEVTSKSLRKIGVRTGADLKRLELGYLVTLFGKRGHILYDFARGIDHRPVQSQRCRKSIGAETTFKEDKSDEPEQLLGALEAIVEKVSYRMMVAHQKAKTLTLKIKYEDFTQITRSLTVPVPIQNSTQINQYLPLLISKVERRYKKVRLVGLTLSGCMEENEEVYENLMLF